MEVKRSEDIHEDPWAFLEKELETFQQVLRELESGKNFFNTNVIHKFPEYFVKSKFLIGKKYIYYLWI